MCLLVLSYRLYYLMDLQCPSSDLIFFRRTRTSALRLFVQPRLGLRTAQDCVHEQPLTSPSTEGPAVSFELASVLFAGFLSYFLHFKSYNNIIVSTQGWFVQYAWAVIKWNQFVYWPLDCKPVRALWIMLRMNIHFNCFAPNTTSNTITNNSGCIIDPTSFAIIFVIEIRMFLW